MNRDIFKYFVIALALLLVFSLWFFWPRNVTFKVVKIEQLPGWSTAKLNSSLQAFQRSCRVFMRQPKGKVVGSSEVQLTSGDWQPVCQKALSLQKTSNKAIRQFFADNFSAISFEKSKPVDGLFTGYYMPLLHGSNHRTKRYAYPIYGPPTNMVTINLKLFDKNADKRTLVGQLDGSRVIPMPHRQAINEGAIKSTSNVLVWVDNRIDRFFLEIQGSGVVEMDDGDRIYIGYAATNGRAYTPVGKILIEKGVFDKKAMSMQAIRRYLVQHPEQMDEVLNQNQSFIFFQKLKQKAAFGAQGVPLTPEYSLAVDRKWIPLGAPLWLNTTSPQESNPDASTPFNRLMIAQDTGGAIKGVVRGDVFWGAGDKATTIAGHMKNLGNYWLLLPKKVIQRMHYHT